MTETLAHGYSSEIIIPHVKIVSCDWLTKVGHSIMCTGEMSTGKTSTILTDLLAVIVVFIDIFGVWACSV